MWNCVGCDLTVFFNSFASVLLTTINVKSGKTVEGLIFNHPVFSVFRSNPINCSNPDKLFLKNVVDLICSLSLSPGFAEKR